MKRQYSHVNHTRSAEHAPERFLQTSRLFARLIDWSIPIQSKIFSLVGMECNPLSEKDTNFRKIIPSYVERINSLRLAHPQIVNEPSLYIDQVMARGGAYAFVVGSQLKLFAPGTVTQEIEIPISSPREIDSSKCCFCRGANVVAFAESLPGQG